jgi:hypothetical protein
MDMHALGLLKVLSFIRQQNAQAARDYAQPRTIGHRQHCRPRHAGQGQAPDQGQAAGGQLLLQVRGQEQGNAWQGEKLHETCREGPVATVTRSA